MAKSKIAGLKTASLPAVDTDPGYKRVAKLIETEIVEGRLNIGDLLPTEGVLAEQLGVHRSTVREGIRSLENAGLVTRAGGKRLKIVAPDPDAVAWVNTRALGLSQATFIDLWELQLQLEPFAARLAAERAKGGVREALEKNLQSLEANLNDDHEVIVSDIEFHKLVSEATGNLALSMSLAPARALLFSATLDLYQTVPPARHRLLDAHRRIADAIFKGKTAVAEEWMAKHIMDFKRGYEVAKFAMDEPIKLDMGALSVL